MYAHLLRHHPQKYFWLRSTVETVTVDAFSINQRWTTSISAISMNRKNACLTAVTAAKTIECTAVASVSSPPYIIAHLSAKLSRFLSLVATRNCSSVPDKNEPRKLRDFFIFFHRACLVGRTSRFVAVVHLILSRWNRPIILRKKMALSGLPVPHTNAGFDRQQRIFYVDPFLVFTWLPVIVEQNKFWIERLICDNGSGEETYFGAAQ